MPVPAKFSEGAVKSNGDVASRKWRAAFNDRKLDDFVSTGLVQNVSILSAIVATTAAQADVIVAGAGGLSLIAGALRTVSGEKAKLRTQLSTNNTSGGILTASWLLDLFGQYRRASGGALATLDADYATVNVTRPIYLQDLVTSYINPRYYHEMSLIADRNLVSRRQTLALTQSQMQEGVASRLDVVQTEGLVNSSLSETPPYEVNLRRQVHHIATLLNVQPVAVIAKMQTGLGQPILRGSVASDVPADLIRNRPDIRAAEHNLAPATEQIGVDGAKLYPSISLSASISPSYIHSSGSGGGLTSWSFGSTLNLPIFDGGSLRANVKIAESNERTSYLTWKSTVLSAIEDIENALSALSRDAQKIASLRAQVRTYEEALNISIDDYRNGASSLLDVLDEQRSVKTPQESLPGAVQQSATDYVSLNVAIGAGYMGDNSGDSQSVGRNLHSSKHTPGSSAARVVVTIYKTFFGNNEQAIVVKKVDVK